MNFNQPFVEDEMTVEFGDLHRNNWKRGDIHSPYVALLFESCCMDHFFKTPVLRIDRQLNSHRQRHTWTFLVQKNEHPPKLVLTEMLKDLYK